MVYAPDSSFGMEPCVHLPLILASSAALLVPEHHFSEPAQRERITIAFGISHLKEHEARMQQVERGR